MNILFVTGTDTGVGKTTVSTLLLRALCERKLAPAVLKPIETGCARDHSGNLVALDARELWEAAGRNGDEADVCVYRYEPPVAPAAAARAEQSEISVENLHAKIRERAANAPLLLIEGAGGLLVPIAENYTFADLAVDVGASFLPVIGSRLGAINHAALTFEALHARKARSPGYLLNELHDKLPEPDEISAQSTNRQLIRAAAARYHFNEITYLPRLNADSHAQTNAAHAAASSLAAAVIEHFDL